jgi:PAS domain S-box-containing protein
LSASQIKKLQEENNKLKVQLQELSHAKNKYKKLFDVSADALSILDLDTGKFIECNQSAIEMHGVETEDNFLNLAPSDISPQFQPCGGASESMAIDRITKTFTEGPQVFQWLHSRLDGSTFPCLVSLTALPIDNKKLVLAIGRDISEIIEIQNKLSKANDAKSIFLANMSHELRTPMTAVLGYTDLMLEDALLADSSKEHCEKIKYATSSLLNIMNEILDMSKLDSGKLVLEYMNLNFPEFIKEAVSVFENKLLNNAIQWQLTIDSDIPADIYSDPTRLKQVLFNLIGNAKKFTTEGSISINCKKVTDEAGDDYIKVSIKDTGIGINEVTKDKIFESFCQADSSTSRKYSGTGLGLPISKKIIELLGGKIDVHGEVDKGSTFWFTIPLVEAKKDKNSLKNLTFGSFKAIRTLNILFAEDNPINQMLAKKVIVNYGHQLDRVENGQLAINAHLENDYDLILMDIRMPEMDGIEATKQIRAIKGDKSHIPIIALTADAMKESLDTYLAVGMNAYSSKPFDWPKLLIIINQVLAEEVHILK